MYFLCLLEHHPMTLIDYYCLEQFCQDYHVLLGIIQKSLFNYLFVCFRTLLSLNAQRTNGCRYEQTYIFQSHYGLLAGYNAGTVKNVTVTNSTLSVKSTNKTTNLVVIGGLVGNLAGKGTITDVNVNAAVSPPANGLNFTCLELTISSLS